MTRAWYLEHGYNLDGHPRQRDLVVRLDGTTRFGTIRHELVGRNDDFASAEESVNLDELVRQAPVVPAGYRALLVSGAIRLLVDGDGVRFVVPRRSNAEAVPWSDFAGPIPSFAIESAGKMAHTATKRTRLRSLASGSRGHGSKKSKESA